MQPTREIPAPMSLQLLDLALLGAAREHYNRDDIVRVARATLADRELDDRVIQVTFSRLFDLGLLTKADLDYQLTRRGVEALRANIEKLHRVLQLVVV